MLLLSNLKNNRFVPCGMAINIYCHWKTRDVAGETFNMHCHCCYLASQSLRSDTGLVHGLQKHFLKRSQLQFGIRTAHWSEKRFLCKKRRLLEVTADAHADNDRWARVRTGLLHAFEHKAPDSLNTLSGPQHPDHTHIFAPRSLG